MKMLCFKDLIKKFPSVWPYYWNNKFSKANIYYLYDSRKTDKTLVNNILKIDFAELKKVGQTLWHENNDEAALRCFRHVYNSLTYKSDKASHLSLEYWQAPIETFTTSQGDCEDGALLLMKLMQYAGIPAWRRKLCCGYVEANSLKEGHAYVIYLADDFNWYCMDWCFFPLSSLSAFKKTPHQNRKEYKDVWFTFNEEIIWSEHNYNKLLKKFVEGE